jgi:hypothetical protein
MTDPSMLDVIYHASHLRLRNDSLQIIHLLGITVTALLILLFQSKSGLSNILHFSDLSLISSEVRSSLVYTRSNEKSYNIHIRTLYRNE